MRRNRRYPPEVVLPAVMAALEAGRSLNAITTGRGGAQVVRLYNLRKMMAANPEWSARAAPLVERNRKAAELRKGDRCRNLTHCKHGHSLHDAYMSTRKGRPYRQCKTCDKLKSGAPINFEMKEKIEALIKKGDPISSFANGGGLNRLITHRTLVRWRNEDREFDRLIEAFRPLRIEKQYNRMVATKQRNAVRRQIDEEKNIYHKIHAMIPKWIAEKDELVSDVFVLIGARSIRDNEIAGFVAQAVAAHSKMFPVKFRKFGDARLISLDQLAFEDGATTIGDQVSRGLWQ